MNLWDKTATKQWIKGSSFSSFVVECCTVSSLLYIYNPRMVCRPERLVLVVLLCTFPLTICLLQLAPRFSRPIRSTIRAVGPHYLAPKSWVSASFPLLPFGTTRTAIDNIMNSEETQKRIKDLKPMTYKLSIIKELELLEYFGMS